MLSMRSGFLIRVLSALLVAGCGLVTVSYSTGGSPGGGGGGGGKKSQKGPRGPLYPYTMPGDSPGEIDYNTRLLDAVKEQIAVPFHYQEASARLAGGIPCDGICFEGVPACEAECAAMHQVIKDFPVIEQQPTIKDYDCPMHTIDTKVGDQRYYSWQFCYAGVEGCLNRCQGCVFPSVYEKTHKDEWRCLCPKGSSWEAKYDRCMAPGTTGGEHMLCLSMCNSDEKECFDDLMELAFVKYGLVIPDSVQSKAKKACEKKTNPCRGSCHKENTKLDAYLEACAAGNLGKVKSGLKFVRAMHLNINLADDSFRTCLHLAATGGHMKVVEYQVEQGALKLVTDIHGTSGYFHIPDAQGKTAYDLASEHGHAQIAAYLANPPAPP